MSNVMDGALAPWASDMAHELERLGYSRRTAAVLMKLAGRLSHWMEERGFDVGELNAEVIEDFFGSLRAEGGWFRPTARTLGWLASYLQQIGAMPMPVPPAPQSWEEELTERYRRYLVNERGLVVETVQQRVHVAQQFLAEQPCSQLNELRVADVTTFMTRQCRRLGVGSTKLAATGLRSFLAFVQLEGLIAEPLTGAVPSAAGWSGAALPRGLAPDEVARLLAGCDRRRATGIRDYAILVLLVRLGLRAAEVSSLRLDDIDWQAGEIVVRGKGRSEERLPLPADVGEAIADYLRRARPRRPEREVFLRMYAPLRGLSPDGVSEVVRAAGERAGLGSFGSHRLRHTAATEMLRAGASLPEVAQVLRQRSVTTTAIYAKVDYLALGGLAMTWPGGER